MKEQFRLPKKSENKEIQKAPEGWETNDPLREKLKIDGIRIKNIASQYRISNPEYFDKFKDKAGNIREYYSPQLVQIIEKELGSEGPNSKKPAPVGWKTKTILSSELGNDPRTIKRIAEEYRKSSPQYFDNFRGGSKNLNEHYSPELIEIIKKRLVDTTEAPIGWKTNHTLSLELGISDHTIEDIAEKYRSEHPMYFKQYKDKKNRTNEHYSPELVLFIKDEVSKIIIENNLKNQNILAAPEDWKTRKAVSRELGFSSDLILPIINEYRKNNPEYFKNFKNKMGKVYEHLSPELIKILLEKINSFPEPPEGWKTINAFELESKISRYFVEKISNKYRISNPEYIKKYRPNGGAVNEYYSPELLAIIKNEVKTISEAPEGWKTRNALSVELKVQNSTIEARVEKYKESNPEYFSEFKDKAGRISEHYSPELVEIISKEISKFIETPTAPEGWITNNTFSIKLKISYSSLIKIVDKYRINNPEYFKEYNDGKNKLVEYYSPELVNLVTKEVESSPYAPDGWQTSAALLDELRIGNSTLVEIVERYRKINPEYFAQYRARRNGVFEHYSPELVKIIKDETEKFQRAPEGWKTSMTISKDLKIGQKIILRIINPYRKSNPDYIKQFKAERRGIFEHYSPELIAIITGELKKFEENRSQESKEDKLKEEFENLTQEIGNEQTTNETAKKIAEIIKLLPGNAHDIILKYHPQYKGLKTEFVKQVIADYLGDFMLSNNGWQPGDIKKLREVLDIEGIKEEILINLKNACLTFVNSEKRNNPGANEYDLVIAYFNKEEMIALASSGIKEVDIALNELRQYYEGIFSLRDKKPTNIMDTLRGGRTFPDINQLVNIQEIRDKKKMLIADEMGLGKSASAILTKEYLGLKCALVVIPSNVEDTWKNYLSDHINEDGKQVGYFKNGLNPKVLVIESPQDLQKLTTEVFDYIIVSQEKISSKQYGEALEKVDFDMMIVDEIHKLKNIESGVRSKAVESLAEKIQGEDKYLALLSGTPVPNKVKDIAISLKLLYPEKYREFDSKEMVKRILYGDLIDLRSELLKRMQMKELATSIEMPPLTELDIPIDLAPAEREIYEILLEEDELTALDKILLFRQFLLNPEILKVQPGFIGSKVQKLSETLTEDFKTQDKIIVFVNGYVEGVIRGEQNIISKMNLPKDVVIEEIHGDISQQERKRIEDELKSSDKKTVVFVSGQTADVGVDFSGADGLIHYNEPWSNYEKRQQIARVYREGLQTPLTAKTLITKNSIEEGIRNYSNAKEKAIKKLLKGINNTDAEKKLLYSDSKLISSNIETNAHLSKEYLSDWEKLMIHFGEGFETGEKRFRQELSEKGKEYAQLYKKLGRLTYQGNNARVTASMLERMINEKGEIPEQLRILDIASGPEMLKEASGESLKGSIISMDINAEHFTDSAQPEKTTSASYLNIPALDGSADYVNLGFAFHQTSPIKYYKKNYERLQVLAEMNRVLKPGGRAMISMLHNLKLVNQDAFNELVGKLGFKVVPEYNGEAKGGESYKADFITLEKVNPIEEYKNDALKFASADNARYITELGDKLGREFLKGLEMTKTSKGSSRLRDQRRMVNKVIINEKELEITFNTKDNELFRREVQTIQDGEELRTKYGGIKNIPLEEIKRIGFERKLETPGYYLLYKIIEDGGAVIIRGDYKSKKTTV